MIPDTPRETTVTDTDVKILVGREKARLDKADYRARKAQERAQAAVARNPGNYVAPPPPLSTHARKRWLSDRHVDWTHKRISIIELTEARRTAAELANQDKARAMVRGSLAAMRGAAASEQIADLLAGVKHGGGVAILAALRASGEAIGVTRRPIPSARVRSLPADVESVS